MRFKSVTRHADQSLSGTPARFESFDGKLYIDNKKVLKGWESYSGWYWFGTEKAWKQDSVIGGRTYEDDQIWYGYVQGLEDEWGHFSQTELDLLKPRVWPIRKQDLPHAGRRRR